MNRFIIADPKRCIGCYACIAGCVEIHRKAGLQAYPRLFVVHTPSGTMPIQCRHCENPSCAAVCPVNAIICRDHSVQINEGLCIGCKLCAFACPFGAIIPGGTPIRRFEFNVGQYSYINSPYQPSPMFLRELDLWDQLSFLSWNIGQKTVAVKCDLCDFNQSGPECISACPHKALRMIDENSYPADTIEKLKSVAVFEEGVKNHE
jgi:hydrogenase-4 component A